MAALSEKSYVIAGDGGALRVGAAMVMLDGILAAWRQGHSPETIRAQYPALSLEEVYGALTWSLAHAEQVREYERQQADRWDHARAAAEADLPEVVRNMRWAVRVSIDCSGAGVAEWTGIG